ncbi:pilus assembly PilX family protein [Nitrosomonas aestuarii]|uniref:pilus assembly PilX family protein n=1 Tax=Nitrosomonas aestuarii TaxID=52441 RepID=UPI000D311B86|nr:pilus assembly PilX N-terminal domain-containing protein [Nitrosomonas aestuarii]PTN12088.1 PilX-like prepilin protein [Nitrosomonas aestuarii]
MMNMKICSNQKGATLVVGLIMLAMITLLTVSGFTLSSNNLKVVGNMQYRNESIAAANLAIEQTINLNYSAIDPANYPTFVNVDIDQDNLIDYIVSIPAPVCISAKPAPADLLSLSGVNSNIENSNDFIVLWEIRADATSVSTGASAIARQGINKRLTLSEFIASSC